MIKDVEILDTLGSLLLLKPSTLKTEDFFKIIYVNRMEV